MAIKYNTIFRSKGDLVLIKKMILHPKYQKRLNYDIAIMHLQKPLNLKFKNAHSICLPKQNDDPIVNTTLTVTGWGKLND